VSASSCEAQQQMPYCCPEISEMTVLLQQLSWLELHMIVEQLAADYNSLRSVK
jgi:hypothetical protein